MKIQYNTSAIIAQNSLAQNDNNLSKAIERLSSGLKLNHAKDNPSGLAISKRMNAQIRGLSVASQNASDGISIVETADGALSEVHDILQRMNELSVKAATGTMAKNDRKSIQTEVDQLKQEINRIAKDTEFNGQNLLAGSFDLRGYSSDSDVSVSYYSDSVPVKSYTVSNITTGTDADGNTIVTTATLLQDGSVKAFPNDAVISGIKGNEVTISAADGFEVKLKADATANDVQIDLTGIGAMRLQVGANEGQVLELRIPEISLEHMGVDLVNVSTAEGALKAIDQIDEAISYISSVRSRLGAYQNRLEHASNSLDITSENMTASYSRIMDVDMAEEMTNFTTNQVLTQAGTSMLAQANERPQQVLQLLQ